MGLIEKMFLKLEDMVNIDQICFQKIFLICLPSDKQNFLKNINLPSLALLLYLQK